MKNKKLIFTFIGLIVLLFFGASYTVWCFKNKQFDPIIATAWMTNVMVLISVYNGANVKQKQIISENYNAELAEKGK